MEDLLKTEIEKLIRGKLVCPPNIEGLNEIVELKNKLTKQLNNLYSKIESINNILNPLEKIIPTTKTGITVAQIAIDAVAFIPSTIVTPIPVGPILITTKVIKTLRNIIGKGEGVIGEGSSSINLLLAKLQQILDLLTIVDIAINTCASSLPKDLDEEGNEIDIFNQLSTQTQISDEILNSTLEQERELSPIITNFNGFEMSVITIEGSKVGSLTRRRAIAVDKSGVTSLQGEPSFSSNDQILIDELVFYIKQNNLKAE